MIKKEGKLRRRITEWYTEDSENYPRKVQFASASKIAEADEFTEVNLSQPSKVHPFAAMLMFFKG
jgi:hypothetical protein